MIAHASRRSFLLGSAALAASAAAPVWGAAAKGREPDFTAILPDGTLQILALTDRSFRVRFVPKGSSHSVPPSDIMLETRGPRPVRTRRGDVTRLALPHITCEID